MNFPANRSSTLWALLALALGVCAVIGVQAQTPPGAGHSLPSLSRVERVLLQPTPEGKPPQSTAPALPSGQPQATDLISISSQYAWRWEESGQAILFTRGQCRVTQGATVLEAEEMVF